MEVPNEIVKQKNVFGREKMTFDIMRKKYAFSIKKPFCLVVSRYVYHLGQTLVKNYNRLNNGKKKELLVDRIRINIYCFPNTSVIYLI